MMFMLVKGFIGEVKDIVIIMLLYGFGRLNFKVKFIRIFVGGFVFDIEFQVNCLVIFIFSKVVQ